MKKRYLFAPGPTPIPEEVQLAMAKPIMHHRAPQFESIMKEVSENLKYLFQTKNEVMIFASSGTGPMEGAVSNTLCKGEKALVVSGGKFGERWIEICSSYGVKTEVIDVEWGTAVDPKKVAKKLQEDRTIKAVLI